ncbi:signal peptidase II [Cellulomonas terrae]|uniref:Lipoprotein signal peptidase n=1 Tax=Cellulomonas terrae TaxID=311234 RepID=A0A511JNS3_9CELL|nr:signal peptidase II [Cellulomonas terrae]GEL99682.1 lipoprotein signal peptidase [Cellulomonas terrae]
MPTTTDDQPDAPPSTRRRALLTTLFSLSAVVLVLDQVSKAWAVSSLVEGERRDLVGNLLGVQLVFNPGAALSIATGMTWVLTIVAAVVIVVIVRASRRIGSWAWAVALGLLLGGALGNLVDRLVREPGIARGHVVDFIAYADWFVGNVADIAIVSAAVMVVVLAALGVHIDGTRDGHGQTEPADEAADDEAVAVTDEPSTTATEQNA